MKKMILSAAVILVLNTAVNGQNNAGAAGSAQRTDHVKRSPEDKAKKDADWAEQKLGLDASQKEKWQAASLEKINANEPLKEQHKTATDQSVKETASAQMKQNSKKFDDTVNGFLTADQKNKWEQARKEKMDARKSGMNKGGSKQGNEQMPED